MAEGRLSAAIRLFAGAYLPSPTSFVPGHISASSPYFHPLHHSRTVCVAASLERFAGVMQANGPYEVVGRTHWYSRAAAQLLQYGTRSAGGTMRRGLSACRRCSDPQRIVVSFGSSLVDPIAAPLTIPPVVHNGRIPGSMAIVGAVGATCVLAVRTKAAARLRAPPLKPLA